MAPVRKVPGGTTTWPPPERWQAAIAAAKAAVFLVMPSPTAPKPVTGKFRGGNQGRRTEATIRSAARSAADRKAPVEREVREVLAKAGASPAEASTGDARTGTVRPMAPRRSMERRSISRDILVLRGVRGITRGEGDYLGSGSGLRPRL